MKALVFYKRRNKQDILTEGRMMSIFGRLSHYEQVGMVTSKKMLDTKGIKMYVVPGRKKVHEPIVGPKITVYYIETGG
jgi:hypothetical protein